MADLKNPSKGNITVEGIEDEPSKTVQTSNSTFNIKNYLNDKLETGQTSKELKIRLLTIDKDSNTPFKHVHMHNVKVPKEISPSGRKSYICLEKTDGPFSEKFGHKCPFCELNREFYQKSIQKGISEEEKEHFQTLSIAMKSNEVGIVRCIERGAEEDGPKFWKFNIRQDHKDPEGVIKTLYKTRKQESIDQEMEDNDGILPEGFIPVNILDLDEGKDLKITITSVADENSKSITKKSVNIVDYGKIKPLTTDEELRDKWVNDEKVWSDVFVAKPYEYLKIVLDGGIPWFDKQNGKWVPKEVIAKAQEEKKEEENQKKTQEKNEADKKIKEAEEKVRGNIETVSDEDLPF